MDEGKKGRRQTLVKCICKYCGDIFESPIKKAYACQKQECQLKRIAEWRHANYHKPMEPRPCCFCREMFLPESRHANRRGHCYKPECIKLQAEKITYISEIRRKEWTRKKKNEAVRLCTICHQPLPPDRYYRHDCCVERFSERTDGDYIYCTEVE